MRHRAIILAAKSYLAKTNSFSFMLPMSEACERNKEHILGVLKRILKETKSVLEIGGGTGQHAVHFAANLPHLHWQSTDFGSYLEGLSARIQQAHLSNLAMPLELDVRTAEIPAGSYDAVFSANSLHIMSASAVEDFFELIGRILQSGGTLVVYGPFNYDGNYSSSSNQQFDSWLKSQNSESAIRDFEWIDSLAVEQGLDLLEDNRMPANNQCLIWQKTSRF